MEGNHKFKNIFGDFQTLCEAFKKGENRQNIIVSEFLGRESAQHRGYEKGPPTSIERSQQCHS